MSAIMVCGGEYPSGGQCFATGPYVPWPGHPGAFYCQSCHTTIQYEIKVVKRTKVA